MQEKEKVHKKVFIKKICGRKSMEIRNVGLKDVQHLLQLFFSLLLGML